MLVIDLKKRVDRLERNVIRMAVHIARFALVYSLKARVLMISGSISEIVACTPARVIEIIFQTLK